MIHHQTPSRYYSRDSLQKFLEGKFGNHVNFNINAAGDGFFTFDAPEALTEVSRRTQPTGLY